MPIYVSNSLDTLFNELSNEIFKKKRTLFSLPDIAVASYGMKRWLKIKFAKMGVALGLKIETLDRTLGGKASGKYDLFIALYHLLQETKDPALVAYLQNRKRIIHLAKLLSRNFYLYGIYGNFLEDSWQKKLYFRLQQAPYLIRFWNQEAVPPTKEIHLFGFSYIPPLFFHTLEKANFYFLSPCQEFWSSQENNPILASFGALGKEMAKQLDGKNVEMRYELPRVEFTLLQALKLDLLFNKEKGAQTIDNFDDHSIELHECTSHRREIEVLYERLLELAEDRDFDPSQVLVISKDITPYVPYIKALFERDDSLFDPILFDQPKGDNNEPWNHFEELIAFGNGRLEKHLYLKFEKDEKIRGWIEQAEILWGYDAEHRNRLLKEAGCKEQYGESDGRGTWIYGFQKLLCSFLTEEEPKIKDGELLGEWITKFQVLYEDLLRITQGQFSAKEWVGELDRFVMTHIGPAEELRQAIKQVVPDLKMDVVLPFEVVHSRLQDVMNQKENVLGDHRLHAIAFSSLFPNRAIPKGSIFFLGAQSKDFPRHEEENSLNLLVGKTFFPTMKQDDRYAFLETILSANKSLYISYQKEKGASSVVIELFDYLDKQFTVEGDKPSIKRFYTHPESYQSPFPIEFFQSLEKKELPSRIDLKDLFNFAKDPLKTFFEKGLTLKLKDADFELEESVEDFSLSPLQKWGMAHLLKGGKKGEALKKAALPIRSFGQIAKGDVLSFSKKLQPYGEPMTLLFHKGSKDHPLSPAVWIKPAIQIGDSILEGELNDVVDRGLLVDDSKTDFSTLAKVWPKILLLGLMGRPTRLIYWKLGKEKEIEIEDPKKKMELFLDYYKVAHYRPSPGHPTLVKQLREKSYAEISLDVENPYWKFLPFALKESDFHFWQAILKELYV